jgi:hypothetical protein
MKGELSMFPIYLYEGNELPEDEICYLIAKQGIFLKKKVGLVESLTKVDKISILNELKPWAKMSLPKIAGSQMGKTISFFKAVVEEFSGEANVFLYYNEIENKYTLAIPKQEVSGAACDYEEATGILGYDLVGTIHSHARMSAFHSSTDDKDEKHFDGLHITIGHLTDDYPSISASIVVNGFRVIVDPCEYIDKCVAVKIPQKSFTPYAASKMYRYINGKMVQVESDPPTTPVVKKYDERYDIQVSEKQKQFNKKWLKKVSRKVYTPTTYARNQRYMDHEFFDFFGSGYDSLTEWMVSKGKEGNTKNILNVGPVKDSVEFPKHEDLGDLGDLDDYNPCINCVFKDSKLEYAYDILQTGIDPGEDLPETNNFEPEETADIWTKDDGSAAYDSEQEESEQTPENLVEEQLRSQAYLHENSNELIPTPKSNPTTPFSKVKKFFKGTMKR